MFQIFFVIALCIDAFTASLAYGVEKTKIPILPTIIISIISTFVLAVSIGIGSIFKQIIPESITGIICFIILFVIGVIKSFESFLKRYIKKNQNNVNQYKLKISDLNFILTVYADNIKADADNSKVLSPKEAVFLAIALSFDSLAAGLGLGMTEINLLHIILLSFISNLAAISIGHIIGNLINKVTNIDFSWLGGIILIILSITKLI